MAVTSLTITDGRLAPVYGGGVFTIRFEGISDALPVRAWVGGVECVLIASSTSIGDRIATFIAPPHAVGSATVTATHNGDPASNTATLEYTAATRRLYLGANGKDLPNHCPAPPVTQALGVSTTFGSGFGDARYRLAFENQPAANVRYGTAFAEESQAQNGGGSGIAMTIVSRQAMTALPLALVRSLRAMTWTLAYAGRFSHSDLTGVFLDRVSIYVWRPSAASVVGRVFDNTADAATHLSAVTASSAKRDVRFTVAGAAVNGIQDGDVLVVELWVRFTKGATASRFCNTPSILGAVDPAADGALSAGTTAAYVEPEFDLFVPAVAVASVTPDTGTIAGGVPVTIEGEGFEAGATVKFGGAAATAVVVVSPTEITCTTPAHAAGAVDVAVTVNGTTATLVAGFMYADPFRIDSVTPAAVHVSGGELQVDGAGYVAGAVVLIAGAAVPATIVSAAQLLVNAPSHAEGVVQLTVRLPSGETRSANLTYEGASLAAVVPAAVRVGDVVVVTGDSLFPDAIVAVGGVPAETTWISAAELEAVVPVLGPGLYDVTVENVAPGYAETLELVAALEVLEPIAALSGGPVIMYVVS
jgi:hypothetical protein